MAAVNHPPTPVLESIDVPSILEEARRQQHLAWGRAGIEVPAARPGLWGALRYEDDPTGAAAPSLGESRR